MKTLLAALAGVSLMAIATTASAENYASIGYTHLDIGAGPATLGAVTGRVGFNTDTWIGVEGEASVGVVDDTIALPAPATDANLKYQLAAFVVAQYPLSDNFKVFARAGFQITEIETTSAGVTNSDNEGGSAFGAGLQYDFGNGSAIRADYTRYDFGAFDDSVDGFTLSYVRKIGSLPKIGW